jgi:hypothetical protein
MIKQTTKNCRAHAHWAAATFVLLVLLAIPLLPHAFGQRNSSRQNVVQPNAAANKELPGVMRPIGGIDPAAATLRPNPPISQLPPLSEGTAYGREASISAIIEESLPTMLKER